LRIIVPLTGSDYLGVQKEAFMHFDKTKVDRILHQLEDVYPGSIADGTKLKEQAPAEDTRLPVLFFCKAEGLIGSRLFAPDAKLKDIEDIWITSKGIRFLHSF
jgi:hypothetical protein